jgi:hypothetical protein
MHGTRVPHESHGYQFEVEPQNHKRKARRWTDATKIDAEHENRYLFNIQQVLFTVCY